MATKPTGQVIYLPDPMNQFNRLRKQSGQKGTGLYVATDPWNNYHNGRDYDALNCTATVGATLWDSWTSGRQHSTPIAIRNHQSDFAGGIGWDDVNEAWWNLYGVRMTLPPNADWADVLYALSVGRDVGIQGDYDAVPWEYQVQKGGTFDHAFSLHGYRKSDGRVLRMDPLGKRLEWVPQKAIRPAAEKLALAQRGSRSRLFVAYTKILVPATTQTEGWRVHIGPVGTATTRSYWEYIIDSSGYIRDRIGRETRGWSARCTPPVTRSVSRLAQGKKGMDEPSYRLVKISDPQSAYNGRWVAAGYAEEL